MNPIQLILKNLMHYRAASLAVVAGMIVATAVLTGSLMVGDSVRGSLRKLAIQRLGPVDYALVSNRFFAAKGAEGATPLVERMQTAAGVVEGFEIRPAIVSSGSAVTGSGDSRKRTGDVQIMAIGDGPTAAATNPPNPVATQPTAGVNDWVSVPSRQVVLNGETAGALGLQQAGDKPVILTFPSKEDATREATVARRGVEELSATLRADKVAAIASDRGFQSLFSLAGGQRTPRNAWVNLSDLQEAVEQPGRANVLLVKDKQFNFATADDQPAGARAEQALKTLNDAVKAVVTLNDYGLDLGTSKATGERIVSTKATFLDPPIVAAAQEAAKKLGVEPRLVAVNLVNRVVITDAQGQAAKDAPALHYVIGAGVSRLDDGPIGPNDIAFNEETAKQLGVKVGDRIRLDSYRRDSDGNLTEITSVQQGIVFTVSKILPMSGVAVDASLTPTFKGLTDSDSVSDWSPPEELKIDEKLAEKDNDAYWKKHKAAPRLLIHIDAARKLWGGPYGEITSIRVPAEQGDAFADALRKTIDPASLGFVFQPAKFQQIQASAGSTDFSGLFVGFSFFLIAAAALLVAMLFRLNVEQRVRQFGLLTAVGFAPGKVRWLALTEGAMLAIVGGLIGTFLGVLYTWLMVFGLRTWWVGAIGTTALELFIVPKTLWAGFIFGFWVAVFAVLWAVWRLGKVSPSRLMAGQLAAAPRGLKKSDGRGLRIAGVVIGLAGLVFLSLFLTGMKLKPELALAGGAVLLTAGMVYLSGVLRPRRHESAAGDVASVAKLGVRNANRHTARSVLSVGLIAFAAFTLITVASMQKQGAGDTGDKEGGAGGYRLIAQTAVGVLGDLNTSAGRYNAGFTEPDAAVWKHARFTQLRRWAGQDISCLNMTRATSPTILGVPSTMVARGGFSFDRWADLEKPIENDTVPVFADAETAQYILKLSVGDTMPITDQRGRPRQLKLVGTIGHSIFQSELLMSEANFRELFPAIAGYGTLLLETPADQVTPVMQALNNELEPYAISVDTTAARLEAFQAIQNTYLSTFRTLGSLGLALGTIGLAVVLIRNVIERRGELALLSAIGFVNGDRVKLVLSENVLLLVLGLGVGTVCALLGIVPTLLTSHSGIAWTPLVLTLVGVLALGLVASVLAVRVSGVNFTARDMRRE